MAEPAEIRGSRWRVQYGEIAERHQFRIGYVGSEAWDGYFPIASLSDVTNVLIGAQGLSTGEFFRGIDYQTEKLGDWQGTISVEPLSYVPAPPLMTCYSADLPELISLLQQLAAELAEMEPDDWDNSKPDPIEPGSPIDIRLQELVAEQSTALVPAAEEGFFDIVNEDAIYEDPYDEGTFVIA